MIDPGLLPKRALLDTTVLLRALGQRPEDARSPACREFFRAMSDHGHEMLVAAPTLAEMLRKEGTPAPRTQGLVVVPFDARAAEVLGKTFPTSVLKSEHLRSGASMDFIKYDALIVACAVRYAAECIVTLDEDQTALAATVGLAYRAPTSFEAAQQPLPLREPPLRVVEPGRESE